MKMKETLKNVIGMFIKTSNKKSIDTTNQESNEMLKMSEFAELIAEINVSSNVKCNNTIGYIYDLYLNKEKGLSILHQLNRIVDTLKDLNLTLSEIDRLHQINTSLYNKNYSPKRLTLISEVDNYADSIEGIETLNNYASISTQDLLRQYNELFEITNGERDLVIACDSFKPLHLNGVLLLIERALSTKSCSTREKNILKLDSLVQGCLSAYNYSIPKNNKDEFVDYSEDESNINYLCIEKQVQKSDHKIVEHSRTFPMTNIDDFIVDFEVEDEFLEQFVI